ncbi:MAG: response regulator [Anaerolineae bacterium]
MTEASEHTDAGADLSEELVRDALLHLYDNSHLLQSPLVPILLSHRSPDPLARAQQLRSLIIDAIQNLAPPPPVLPRSKEWRPYGVLLLRCIDRMTDERVQRELSISERQLYRDLKTGVSLLTEALRSSASGASRGQDALASSLDEVGLRVERVDLVQLLHQVLPLAGVLAQSLGKSVEAPTGEPRTEAVVVADEALSRQALISALSYCLQRSQGNVALSIEGDGEGTAISLRYLLAPSSSDEGGADALELARRLLTDQGGVLLTTEETGSGCLCLRWPRFREPTVLVVDDDEAMLRLFSRYLAGHGYDVVCEPLAARAPEVARECGAQLVVLDVMMRERDGWTVLQRIKAQPETKDVPVLVCTVVNEPQLAQALGAAGFLRKPVTREQLVEVVGTLVGI